MTTSQTDQDTLREQVRARYAAAATKLTGQGDCGCGQPAGCGCGESCCGGAATAEEPGFGAELYGALDRDQLPDSAVLASLGCGNPTAVAELRQGETVLDLGSGGGIDVLLSAKRVGPTGKAYGLDMTEEMLALARANAAQAGATNVEFLKGQIEAIPLPAGTVEVVISNCVVNLSTDKPAVFQETFRVLQPGGRLGITDVVAEDQLSATERAERGAWVGCIAGALSKGEYQAGLAAAGFEQVSVTFTHQVGDGLHSAIIKATKPTDATSASTATAPASRATLPMVADSGCCYVGDAGLVSRPGVALLPMRAEVLKGHLDGLLLATLEAGPLHGYAVMEALRVGSGGRFDLPTGTVYPALHRLERAGLIRSRWSTEGGRRRRSYELTAAGRRALAGERSNWREFSTAVSALLEGRPWPTPA